MSVKLESLDKKIVIVDQNVIKQMVTIQNMLENERDDTNNNEPIPIYAANGEILEKVVEWTKHHIETTEKSVIKAWGDQFFRTNLEKIFQIEKAADYLEVKTLCIEGEVFQRNFELFTTTEAFKNLSREKLGLLLSRNDLNVPGEQRVVQSLETWISTDPEERSAYLKDIVPYIRASFLPRQFIEYVKNFLVDHSLPDLCLQLNYESKTPRHGYDQSIVTVQTREDGKCLMYLDSKTETWTHLTDIPEEHSRGFPHVCCVEGNIYLVGGLGDRRVTEYNLRTNTWRNMPRFEQARNGHFVCTLNNKIFVMGGGDPTCEMLDLSDDDPHWKYMAQMNRVHFCGSGAVISERKIYVLGTPNGTPNVEMYDVDQDQWKIVTNMPKKRYYSGVAALGNKVYVTGGKDDWLWSLSSVDCYDPDSNTWSPVANMNIARYGHSLVSLHGRLYAIGGCDVGYFKSVEVYDPDNNTWTLSLHKLDGEVFDTGAALIKNYHVNK